jgi:lipopolysaccharide export system protein LptC
MLLQFGIGENSACNHRDNVAELEENCRRRNSNADPQLVAKLYTEYVAMEQQVDAVRKERNDNAASMKVRHRTRGSRFFGCCKHL